MAGMLAIALGACDNDKVSVTEKVEEVEPSDELKAFLESPPGTNVSGAHKQSDPHANLSAEKMAQVALQHFDEGRAELGVETLNEAIGKYPGNVMLLGIRASMFLQQQQPSLALADLNRAIEINPHDAILLINRAQAYRQFGRNDEARRDLDGAIEIDPNSVAAYFNRGSLLFEAEKYDLALADFDRCVELEPALPAAYFNRASTYEALGQRDKAVGDLEHFLTLNPEESWAEMARDILKQWDPDLS